ncbi:class I SAM-dependent methyltransferase [Candidatus Leptofilum sp.]|uniref:class I SAM-dependent methyltransferase n=1 Tax=Candidatus Leptofilum sp. TaxID=3241576 RepID=UPI003B5B931B
MDEALQEALERFTERYANGEVPWDDALPPPEVQALASSLPPGRALDLGCGYGRTAIYLAQNGWRVDAIDFVPEAITEAKKRAAEANVAGKIQFHVGSVADLDFLTERYDLAIDIGCMHALTQPQQQAYRDGLLRLLNSSAPYLLFARLQEPQGAEDEEDARFQGLLEEDILALFTEFKLQRSELGVTEGSDYRWRSGWFWYER